MKLASYVFLFCLFSMCALLGLDPDFGWHIRMGEIILKQGIPPSDPFSYTMSSFPVIAHEWLWDVVLFQAYPVIGSIGLSLFFSGVALLSIAFRLKGIKVASWQYGLVILAGVFLAQFLGIRPQLFTWLCFSLLLLLLDKRYFSRFKLLIPVLFLLWVNIHGGFAIGLVVFFIKTGIEIFQKTQERKAYCAILFLSVCATIANPYGILIWEEIYATMGDGSLRWSIAEWLPAVFNLSAALWAYVAISFVFVIRARKKLSLFEQVLYIALFLAGIASIRHMPFWVLSSLPITIVTLSNFYKEAIKTKYGRERINKAIIVLNVLIGIIIAFQVVVIVNSSYVFKEDRAYPIGAIEYLKTHQINGEIFTTYQWGGYFIWKYPSRRVFIDGRMPSWSNKNAPIGESSNAFKDYRAIVVGQLSFSQIEKKYDITVVVLPREKKRSNTLRMFQAVEDYNTIRSYVEKEQWKKVYEDKVADVYVKN